MNDETHPALYPTPGNAAPPGAEVLALRASDGTRLRAALWPALGSPRGTVALLQGRTETIEKYFETVAELRARAFAVATLDWRGQGASARLLADPLKGHVHDYSDYLDDLRALMTHFQRSGYPTPYHVLAHSQGALIALLALRERQDRFAKVVALAPLLSVRVPFPALARALARLAPRHSVAPGGSRFNPLNETFDTNPVTRDAERFARNVGTLQANPSLALGSPTFGWVAATYRAMDRVLAPGFAQSLTTPVFIVSAEEDLLVDNKVQARLAAALPRCRHVIIPGARHEILMERDEIRWAFWRHFDAFIAEGA